MHIKYLVPIWQVYGYCIYLYIPLNIVTIYYYYLCVCVRERLCVYTHVCRCTQRSEVFGTGVIGDDVQLS